MKNKVLTILALTALVLGVSACGKKEVASVVSEVTSVTEKVQETSTSIAEKIDSINSTEGKTDLSEHPEVEVPEVPDVLEVPEVEESKPITQEEFDYIFSEENKARYMAERGFTEEDLDETTNFYLLENYISEIAKDDTKNQMTLEEYFGSNLPDDIAEYKDETIKHYYDAYDAYSTYEALYLMGSINEMIGGTNHYSYKEEREFHENDELTKMVLEGNTPTAN